MFNCRNQKKYDEALPMNDMLIKLDPEDILDKYKL